MSDLDFVRSLARHLCHDTHDADDVAQDAMLRALEKRPADVGSWRGWLTVVTRNLALNRRRGERRREVRELATAGDLSVPSASEVAEQEQLRKHVVDAVMELPVEFRSVVLLRHYRGLDTRECAKQLGIPEGTVRTRLKRGVDRLRAKLDEQHGDRATWVSGLLPFVVMDAKRAAVVGGMSISKMLMLFAALLLMGVAVIAWGPWGSGVAPPSGGPASVSSSPGANGGLAAGDGAVGDQGSAVSELPVATRSAVAVANDAPWQLEGIVANRGDASTAIAGADVRVWLGPVGTAYPVRGEVHEVTADAHGRFVFSLKELCARVVGQRELAVFVGVDADGYRPQWQQAIWLGSYAGKVAQVDVALEPGVFTKGRIVDGAGVPVRGASLLMIAGEMQHRALTDTQGRFVIGSLATEKHGYDRVLMAMHDSHGFSRARHVRIRDGGDTRVDDLVVANPVGLLHGHVRDPNGVGVAGVELAASRLSVEGEGDSHEVDGVRIRRFVHVTAGSGANAYIAKTDANGYFRFCTMRPGQHEVWVRDRVQRQKVRVSAATDPVTIQLDEAVIRVRAVDARGADVPLGMFAVYEWAGAKAADAARRFEARGATSELLRTGTRLHALRRGHQLKRSPDTFVVIEMDHPSIGASYGSCYLGPRDYRGEAIVRVVAPERAGSLRIDVRDQEGADVQPLLIKMCRVAGVRAVPVRGIGAVVRDSQGTMILGDWIAVPADGVLRSLPVGDFTVEVLAGAEVQGGEVRGAPFLPALQEVSIGAAGSDKLKVRVEKGVELSFDLRLPSGGQDALGLISTGIVFLRSADGSQSFSRTLTAGDGGRIKFDNGRCLVRAGRPVPKGVYSMTVGAGTELHRELQDLKLFAGMGAIQVRLTK